MQPFEKRLDSLEKVNRHWKYGTLALLTVMFCGASMAASYSKNDELSAQRIMLHDRNGKVRCKLETTEGGGVVQTMLDADGTERLKLMIDDEGTARLRVYDEKNKDVRSAVFAYRTDHEQWPSFAGLSSYSANDEFGCEIQTNTSLAKMTMFGQKQLRHITYADGEGAAGAGQYGSDGNLLLHSFTTKETGSVSIQMLDAKHQERWSANVFNNGSSSSRLSNQDGKPWSVSSSSEKGVGQAVYFDGQAKAELFITKDGTLSTHTPADLSERIIESLGLTKPVLDTLRMLAEG